MTMKERHATNDRICEVHHKIDVAAVGNVHRIEPHWIVYCFSVHGIHQEVNLMDVKWMHFFSLVRYPPVLKRTNIHRQHGTGVHLEFLTIYIEALFVFSEVDYELRFARFNAF